MKFRIIQSESDDRYYVQVETKFLFWKSWRYYDRAVYGFTNPTSGFVNLLSAEYFVAAVIAREQNEIEADKKRGFKVIKEIEL